MEARVSNTSFTYFVCKDQFRETIGTKQTRSSYLPPKDAIRNERRDCVGPLISLPKNDQPEYSTHFAVWSIQGSILALKRDGVACFIIQQKHNHQRGRDLSPE
jgi:hypothetical protein